MTTAREFYPSALLGKIAVFQPGTFRLKIGIVSGLFGVALSLGLAGNAHAAEFTVITAGIDAVDVDPGNGVCASIIGCTLRAAVMEANVLDGPDTIIITSIITNINLTITGNGDASVGALNITDDVSIIADRLDNTAIADVKDRLTTIDASAMNSRIFGIENDANVLLRGLRLTGGNIDFGGAILVSGGTLTIEHSVLQYNHASSSGGAISVFSTATLNLDNVDIADNTADVFGAGISSTGTVLIRRSSIRNNVSAADYAQISNSVGKGTAGTLTIENSTITGANNADIGIDSSANSTLVMDGVTVANHTGTGVYVSGTPASLSLSRTAFHSNGTDCNTEPAALVGATLAYNWFEDAGECGEGSGTNHAAAPLSIAAAGDLTTLTTNNHTVTYYYDIPNTGSALLEQGGTVAQGCALTTDQLGAPRPYNGNNVGVNACDIGAVEFNTRLFADGFESL